MKKVLVFSNDFGNVPKVVTEILKNADDYRTGEVIDKIDNISKEVSSDDFDTLYEFLSENSNRLAKVEYNFPWYKDICRYFGINEEGNTIGYVDICEIDERVPWVITKTARGTESIEMMPNYVLCHSDLNLYEIGLQKKIE